MRFLVYCGRFFIPAGRGNDFFGRDSENGRILMLSRKISWNAICRSYLQKVISFEIQFRHDVMTNSKFTVASCETLQWQRCIRLSQAPLPLLTSLKRVFDSWYETFQKSFQTITTRRSRCVMHEHETCQKVHSIRVIPSRIIPTQRNRWLMRSGISISCCFRVDWRIPKKSINAPHKFFYSPVKLIWCPYKTTH